MGVTYLVFTSTIYLYIKYIILNFKYYSVFKEDWQRRLK